MAHGKLDEQKRCEIAKYRLTQTSRTIFVSDMLK
jgi:hypothetical protein